jgi:hypothetical protein
MSINGYGCSGLSAGPAGGGFPGPGPGCGLDGGGRGAAQGRPLGRIGILGAGQIEDAHELGPRASAAKSWAVATVGQFDRMAPRTGPQENSAQRVNAAGPHAPTCC